MTTPLSRARRPRGATIANRRDSNAGQRSRLPRFHLMIGAAGSGKSTAARLLARHLQQPDEPAVRYVSSAAIREELYGDSRTLGRWAEVEAEIHEQLCQAQAAQETVILEACYVKRAFRLAITQALHLPQPVQWVGWWLDTPLALCLSRNSERADPVPEAVIHKHCAQLLQAGPVPHRQEGFAAVVRLQVGQGVPLETLIRRELGTLERSIQRGANRDAAHQLHGYSRLLDHERLLYLIQLLSGIPKLTTTNAASSEEGEMAEKMARPGLAEQAAAMLGRVHGACYADPLAVARDLAWLQTQGFTTAAGGTAQVGAGADPGGVSPGAADSRPRVRSDVGTPGVARVRSSAGAGRIAWSPVAPPPWPLEVEHPVGGLARLADREAFSRVFTLLRHLLLHPFDIDNTPGVSGMGVCEHLARRLNALKQQAGGAVGAVWTARQVHAALTSTLTPYGFRVAGSSGRHGYALGTALLDLDQLVAVQGLLRLQAEHLGDRKAAAISSVLAQRLGWIGVNLDNHPPVRRWLLAAGPPLQRAGRTRESRQSRRPGPSTRVNRPTPHTLPAESPLETAIRQRQRVLLSHQQEGARRSAPLAVWPLQLVLQGERWWLLMEHDAIGQREALLESLPLEEVHVFHQEWRPGRSLETHCEALARWERLRRHGGSLHVGNDLAAQLALGSAPNLQGVTEGWERLRFCCTPRVMGSIRRELDRFPTSAIRLARPLPGHSWGRPEPRAVLPLAENPRHPYPVEVALPPWVLAGDPELRRWLFSYGAAIHLEGPRALVEEHRRWLQDALKAQAVSQDVQQRDGREDARRQEKTDSVMASSLMANSLMTSGSKVSASDMAEQENLALTRRHPRKPSGSPGMHSAQLCPLCGGPMVPLAPGGN